ncbi:MAG: hypothetical protein ABI616_15450 [Pseudomonadota bacterium]
MRQFGGFVAMLVLLAAPVAVATAGGRIEEARYLPVGGIQQWVTIRGDDDRNPVLMLLHGGPGDVQSPFVTTCAPYEHQELKRNPHC